MVIDFTPELAPFLWGMLGTLVLATAAILLSIDQETTEGYAGNRRLVVASSAVAIIVAVCLAAGPGIASSLGLALR